VRNCVAVIHLCAAACLAAAAGAPAQESGPAIEKIRTELSHTVPVKKNPAAEEFEQALDAIKRGNEAQSRGNSDDAYCLYDEAVMRLNAVKGKYPDWERDKVMKQIKNILEVKNQLEAVVCKEHEEMKEARCRFLVWQRQVAILRKLDIVTAKLQDIEKQVDENRKDIRDIREVIVK